MSLNVEKADHKKRERSSQPNVDIGSIPPADMHSVYTPGEMTPGPQFPSVDPTDHDSQYSMYYRASPPDGQAATTYNDGHPTDLGRFTLILIVSQLFGLATIILCAMWTGYYLGGFAWSSEPSKIFNYHPLLAVVALVVLQGDTSLVYRAMREWDKKLLKGIHAILHITIFILAAISLRAVFKFHNAEKITNMYSLHSWLGIGTVVIFSIQYLLGFGFFIIQGGSDETRRFYLKIHRIVGLATFALSVVTTLVGIQQKLFIELLSASGNSTAATYEDFSAEGIVANSLGLVIVLFASCVVFLLLNPAYQRKPLDGENRLILQPE